LTEQVLGGATADSGVKAMVEPLTVASTNLGADASWSVSSARASDIGIPVLSDVVQGDSPFVSSDRVRYSSVLPGYGKTARESELITRRSCQICMIMLTPSVFAFGLTFFWTIPS
jgi:hypothetical protein